MQINISTRQLEMTDPIEEYVKKKCEKLTRFYDRIQSIDVVMDTIPHGYMVEIIADVEHHDDFVAKAENDDLYACVDQSVDKAIRQLHDFKERIRDDRRHAGGNTA